MYVQMKGVEVLLFHKKVLFYEFGILNSLAGGTENGFFNYVFIITCGAMNGILPS